MKKQGVFLNEFKAESTEAQIDIVGVIGWEVAFTEMKSLIAKIPDSVGRVVFNIYSPGGDVWDGNGIVQAIGELSKRKETVAKVQVAASMATLIAVACNKRSIAANGRFLVHNAWTVAQGDAAELEKRAVELRACEQEAAKFYSSRTGKTTDEMLVLMNEERWLTPEETKAFGFVQEIDDPFKPEELAQVKAEIEASGKWPKALVMDIETETKKEEGNADGTTEGGKEQDEGSTKFPEHSKSADEYKLGLADGIRQAEAIAALRVSEAISQIDTEALAIKERLKKIEAVASKYQSDLDKAKAEKIELQKSLDGRIKELTEKLVEANGRLSKLVSGAMSFSPSEPQTWQEAMRFFGGDYVKAAKAYPELKKAFNANKNK